MPNCCRATRRPRKGAGENLGDVQRRDDRSPADAQPAHEAEEHQGIPVPGHAADGRDDVQQRDGLQHTRRPKVSAGLPTAHEPTMVPKIAEATVKPCQSSLSLKAFVRSSVVPEMTIVSKPNNRPPKAATSALPKR